MAKKFAFTLASIDALQKGLQGDPFTPGLAIEVVSSRKKRWRYRRQVAYFNSSPEVISDTTVWGNSRSGALISCLDE